MKRNLTARSIFPDTIPWWIVLRLTARLRSCSPVFDEVGVAREAGVTTFTLHQTDAGVNGRMCDNALPMRKTFSANLQSIKEIGESQFQLNPKVIVFAVGLG